ncbi:MAG: hypothetical protein KA184_02930 [Candidatus Hydrogenedentes bacterium]|nr:hypothetical protein [Candidatus Hydrogenedentota bacterium]
MFRTFLINVCASSVAAWLAACATGPDSPQPFTQDWRRGQVRERAFQQRLERLRGGDEVVLMGEEGKSRAAVYMDEKGRPRLNIGRETGLSADLDYEEGPEATVKYKVKWDFAKPDRKK